MEKTSPNPSAPSDLTADPLSDTLRILIVRGGELRDRVDRAITVADVEAVTVVVPTFLAAMGDLTQTPADVVIGPVDALAGMIESTAASLRQLSPSTRLVVTARMDQRKPATAAVRAGFDIALVEPFDTGEIVKALDLVGYAPTPLSGIITAEQVAAADRSPSVILDAPPPAGRHQSVRVADDQLGDADLIDVVMSNRGRIDETAMRIVSAQSGIEGIVLLSDAQQIPSGQVAAPVVYRDQVFGHLVAPESVERGTDTPHAQRPTPHDLHERLTGWAHWLARWLALAHQYQQFRDLAMKDELTGLWNRRYFNRFLERILDRAKHERQQVTLLVFDIDDFKLYNDHYGHAAGDEILKEAARLMQSVVREHDVVARIGGDEFAVIFWDADEQPRRQGSQHPHDVRRAAQRFQAAICAHRFPKLAEEAPGTLTISGGLAGFPWDGKTPDELLEAADGMALQSKRQGKNAITFGPGSLREREP